MTLLQWEDLHPADAEEAVWMQRTIRFLVPRGAGIEEAWTADTVTSTLVGEPVECPCGAVAIRYGEQYTWGRDRYGKLDDSHRVRGQYCPSCDGGEDDP